MVRLKDLFWRKYDWRNFGEIFFMSLEMRNLFYEYFKVQVIYCM